MRTPAITFAHKPYRLSGVVVGSLMKHGSALAALGATLNESPSKAGPKGLILCVKPRSMWSEGVLGIAYDDDGMGLSHQ